MHEKFIDGLELAERAKQLRAEVSRLEADLRPPRDEDNPHYWRPSASGRSVMFRPSLHDQLYGAQWRVVCRINGQTHAERRAKARAWIAAQRAAFDAEQERKAEEAKIRIRRCYDDPAWGAPIPEVDLASVDWSRATAHEVAALINREGNFAAHACDGVITFEAAPIKWRNDAASETQ